MKIQPILTAMAVAFAAIAQPAVAEFTQNAKGEVTHHNGIPLRPIPTVAEARAQTQKNIAARKAQEAEQAQQLATRNPSPAAPPQEVFFTGKPYIEETGQYLFLFRHYNPELSRWTTADPSGFPDGANNSAYMAVPTTEFDWQGLESVNLSHTFQAYSGVSTVMIAQIDGTWSQPPLLADKRWGQGTQTGGSKMTGTGSSASTVSWSVSDPNVVISNITDDGGSRVKTYSMDLKWIGSLGSVNLCL